ncbi:MAG: flavodoxin [Candidatus Omnitrophica bacterium]|nr:flavodoxin [Candidatus Omnitrophota bacterium]
MKIGIIYGSMLGSTQSMSQKIADIFGKTEHEVNVSNVQNVQPKIMLDYDVILLGCSTWGDGVLQDDFISFEENMKEVDLSGKKAAVFGPGDSTYARFCEAVDILDEKLIKCGAEIIHESLKIDGDVESQMDKVKDWTEGVMKKL